MPTKELAWVVALSGSACAFLLGLVFFAIDRTWVLLPFGLVTLLAWLCRPHNWREVIYKLF